MIRFLFLILALAITLPLLGQNKCDSVQMFPQTEELPVFDKNFPENNMEKLYKFIGGDLRYPVTAREDNITGEVHVQFWVDTNGYTTEHRIIKSVREDLDTEVLRVAKMIKFDIPAKNSGKSVGTCLTLPFRFTIVENVKPLKHIKKSNSSRKSNRWAQ